MAQNPTDVEYRMPGRDASARPAPGAGATATASRTVASPSSLEAVSRAELVSAHAHLVKYVVGRLGVSIPGVFDHEDAMQAGVMGLLRAIDAFRADSETSFESYAIIRIRGAILDAVRALDTIGRAGREAGRQIQGAIAAFQAEFGRTPSESEVAVRLGLSVDRYRERLQAATVVTVSLDELSGHGDDNDASPGETAPDPQAVDPLDAAVRGDELATLAGEVTRLGERQRLILALYYQDGLTFREIGRVLGVTESRVCQIHTEILLGLRARLLEPGVARRLSQRRARP
jgi:RNA polymerase sigma factor for flagellar operon FliA